jgi:hypothetical protein
LETSEKASKGKPATREMDGAGRENEGSRAARALCWGCTFLRPAVLNGKKGKTDERTFSDVRARSSCPLSMWLSANVTENGNVTATGETERTRSVASEIGLRRDVRALYTRF